MRVSCSHLCSLVRLGLVHFRFENAQHKIQIILFGQCILIEMNFMYYNFFDNNYLMFKTIIFDSV